MRGVLIGAVTHSDKPGLGISVGQETIVVSPEYAVVLFHQLGYILEEMGVLGDPDGADKGALH